jgi:hypothetical protein
MKSTLLILVLVILASCSPQRRLAGLLERFPLDTIKTTTIEYRDTIVEVPIPGDTAFVETEVPVPYLDADSIAELWGLNCDQKDLIDSLNKQLTRSFDVRPIYNETAFAKSKAWIANGILKSELTQKDSIIDVVLDSVIQENITIERIPYPEYIPAKPLYKYGFFIFGGLILISLILLIIFRRR